MSIELTEQEKEQVYLIIEEPQIKKEYCEDSCIIDGSTTKGKIILGITYIGCTIIMCGSIAGFAYLFSII